MPIFLSNPLLVVWENSNPPPTHQSLNLADWLQILMVLTRLVRRVGQVSINNVLLKTILTNYNSLLHNLKMSHPKPQRVWSMRKTSQVPVDFFFFPFLFDNPIHKIISSSNIKNYHNNSIEYTLRVSQSSK